METFTPGSPRPPATPRQGKLRYFASARQGASLAQLLRAVRMAPGVIVLHGPSGAGKSLLCERLARALEGQPFEALSVSSHLAHSIDLVNMLCDSLGLERSASAIVDRLVQPANPLVLMLDHADDIDDAVLRDALTLLASRDVVHPSLRLVLVGGEALVARTEVLCPAGVSRRNVALGTLRREDLRPYLLFIHGDDEEAVRLFDGAGPEVYARIATRTACLPGAINTLAATLLAEAAASPVHALTTELVDELSAEHLQGEWRRPGGSTPASPDADRSDPEPSAAPPLLAPVSRAAPRRVLRDVVGASSTDDTLEHTIFARPKPDGSPTDLAPVQDTSSATPRPSRVLDVDDLRAARGRAASGVRRPAPRHSASEDAVRPAELPLPERSDDPDSDGPDIEHEQEPGERGTFGMVVRYAALAIGGLAIFVGLTGSPMLDSLLERFQGSRTPPAGVSGDAAPDNSAARAPSPIQPALDQGAPTTQQPTRMDTARGSITRAEPPKAAPAGAGADGGAAPRPATGGGDPTSIAGTSPPATSPGDGVLGHNTSSAASGSSTDNSAGTGSGDSGTSTGSGDTGDSAGIGNSGTGTGSGDSGESGTTTSPAADAVGGAGRTVGGDEETGASPGTELPQGTADSDTVSNTIRPANAAAAVAPSGAASQPGGSDDTPVATGTATDAQRAADGVAGETPGATSVTSAGTIAPVSPSAPGVGTTALEDEAVSLAIALPRTSAGDVLDLSGLPGGSSVAGGTRIDEGRWRLPATQVNAVVITPRANFAGSFDVVATLRRATDGSSTTAKYPVNIEPVADTPRLDVRASPGDVNSALPLEVRASLADGDGSERLTITLRDLPPTVQVSAGTQLADGNWRLRRSDLKGLYLTPLPGTPELLRFKVVATAQEQSGNATAEVVRSMELRVVPDR